MLVRRRVRILTGSSEDQVEYDFEIQKDYDFVQTLQPRLNASTAWVGPTEITGMPDVVDLMVENTDSADDIRVYYKTSVSGYTTLKPGEVCYWPALEKGTTPNEWKIVGQGAGLVDCKVTILGNY